jgi:ubiquinol-cytochrome c reductase iron-sulfur subunit
MAHSRDKSIIRGGRRRFLLNTTSAVAGVGVLLASAPFVKSMSPSERAKALGGPVQVDISKLELGQMITHLWRSRPIWVLRRAPEMLARLDDNRALLADPDSIVASQQPLYAQNSTRSLKPEYLVVIGLCTHLGCVPVQRFQASRTSDLGEDWPGGYYCPCHGSKFDLAGRVFRGVPAPTNLVVPPHRYLTPTIIEIGVDHSGA